MNKKGVKYISITQEEVVIMIEKNVKVSMLLEIYGKLLTGKQQAFLEDYYNNDLSLAELAENYGITRQAARDNIKKGEKKLFSFEEKLKIMENLNKREEKIAQILSEITTLQTTSSDKQVSKTLDHIMKKLSVLA